VIVMATGSEVELALAAHERLSARGVAARVVSMPCFEFFAQQPAQYRDSVLPPDVPHRVAVEAASPQPWYRWVGERGAIVGLERFGASAPYQRVYKELGITVERVVEEAERLLA
jgi:transketolase